MQKYGEVHLLIYSSKGKKEQFYAPVCLKHVSSGFLIQCDASRHVSYTRKKEKSSKSNSNVSLKWMQCSIFSNTVYKAELHWWDSGFPVKADPSLKQWQVSCIFPDSNFSVHPGGTDTALLIQLFHTSRSKKRKKRKFAFRRGIFITLSLLSWDSNGSSLMQFCSTLSYRCEKDVQFKQMSHAEIARHERKARKHLHNPWTKP